MRYMLSERQRDELILVARVLLVVMFVVLGWGKVTNFSATAAYMGSVGLPLPALAVVVAIAIELFGGLAIGLGFYTRPLAVLLAVYAIVTAFIGHDFWMMEDGARRNAMIHFYKNFSIAGGMLLLFLTGPGKYSLDRK